MRLTPSYETRLAAVLGLTFGFVLFDRNAINILSPFIVADLHLSNTQLGVASSITSLTWALAGGFVGWLASRSGARKPYLIAAIVVFSVCSAVSGLANGFLTLLVARLFMGLGEGMVPPLNASLLLDASSPARRGLNTGLSGLCGGLIGGAIAPAVLVMIAERFDWRVAFFVTGVPGLICAALVLFTVREAPARRTEKLDLSRLSAVLRVRNVRLCMAIATLGLAAASSNVFLPLYLVSERHMTPGDVAFAFGLAMGLSLMLGLAQMALSDRIGRRAMLMLSAPFGLLIPLGALYWSGPPIGLAVVFGAALLCLIIMPLAIGLIPGESVAPQDRTLALALVMGVAEIAGAFVAPSLMGVVADQVGLVSAPIMGGCCALLAAILAAFLTETAPSRVNSSAAAMPVAANI